MDDDWTGIYIEVPPGEREAILRTLRAAFNFADDEYLPEMMKPDGSRVSWGPIDARQPGRSTARELAEKWAVQRVAYPSATDAYPSATEMEGARVDQERSDMAKAAERELLAQVWHVSHCMMPGAGGRWIPREHWYDCMTCDPQTSDGFGNPHWDQALRADLGGDQIKRTVTGTPPAKPWASDPRPGFGSEPPE